MYKMDQKSLSCFPRKHTQAELKLNWDNVVEYPAHIELTEINKDRPKKDPTHIIFQTVFQNAGYTNQHHKLRAEGHTSMVCNSHLTEGYTKGSEVGLFFPSPIQNTNSNFKFSKGFSMKHAQNNDEEKKTSWVIDDFISVPRQTRITVSKSVKERKQDFSFTGKVGFEGSVLATFKDKKKSSIIVAYPIPIETIIKEELPEYLTITKTDKKQSFEKGEKDTKHGEKDIKNTKENIEKRKEDTTDGQKYLKNENENIKNGENGLKNKEKDSKNLKVNMEKEEKNKKVEGIDIKNAKEITEKRKKDTNDGQKYLKNGNENIKNGEKGLKNEEKDSKNLKVNIEEGEKDTKDKGIDLKSAKENTKKGEEDKQVLIIANENIEGREEGIEDGANDSKNAKASTEQKNEHIKDEQEHMSYIIIKGKCNFEYEIEQEIDIKEQMFFPLVSPQCSET